MAEALIIKGGWEGHYPDECADFFYRLLTEEGFKVEVSSALASFSDKEKLGRLSLLIPVWTMGEISSEQLKPTLDAVANGLGLAGCHGGMCDAFRTNVDWQFMTGGQWVAHPGSTQVEYTVNIKRGSSPIVEGIEDFTIISEQYYLHVDPAVEVLATTRFPVADGPHVSNGQVDMPVVWTKRWGRGRVFYCSLGHEPGDFQLESVKEIIRRGFLWAAKRDF